jgi:hypothetical protein
MLTYFREKTGRPLLSGGGEEKNGKEEKKNTQGEGK